MKVDQKSKCYHATRVSPCARNTTGYNSNSFTNRNIFFVDRPRRAARVDMLIRMKENSQLPSYPQ